MLLVNYMFEEELSQSLIGVSCVPRRERCVWVRWLCSWKPGNEADMWHQPAIFAFPAIITMWAIVLSSLIGSSLPPLLMLCLTLWCNYCKYPPDNSQLSPSQSASNYHHHHPGSSLCCYKGIQVDLWFSTSSWVQYSALSSSLWSCSWEILYWDVMAVFQSIFCF